MSSFLQNKSKRPASGNSRSFQNKINRFELKYSEFVNNCSAYLKPADVHPQNTFLDRSESSETAKENARLKRRIEILSKTIEEINRMEKSKNDLLENQILSQKLAESKDLVERLQSELEFLKNSPVKEQEEKKSQSPPEKGSQRSRNKERNFTPIKRSSLSPIYTSVTQKAREQHSLKKKLKDLEAEIAKVKEERDLFKFSQMTKNSQVSTSLELISYQYEIEIQRLQAINSILQKNFERFSKLTKDFIKETSEIIPFKRSKEIEPLKMKIFDAIRESLELKDKLISARTEKMFENKSSREKISQVKQGVEVSGKETVAESAPATMEGFFEVKTGKRHSNSADIGERIENSENKEGKMNEIVLSYFSEVFSKSSQFDVGLKKLLGRIEEIGKKSKTAGFKIKALKAENFGLKKKVKDSEALIEKAGLKDKEISRLLEIKKYLEDSQKRTEKKVAEKDSEIQEIVKGFNKAQDDLKKSLKKIEENNKKMKNLEEIIAKNNKETDDLKKKLENKEREVSSLSENLGKDIEKYKNLHFDSAEKMKNCEESINKLTSELKMNECLLADMNNELKIYKDLVSSSQRPDKNTNGLGESSDTENQLKESLSILKTENSKLLNELSSAYNTLDDQKNKLCDSENKASQLQQENDSLSKIIETYRLELSSFKKNNEELSQKINSYQAAIEEHKKLNTKNESNEDQKNLIKIKDKEIEKLKNEIREEQETLKNIQTINTEIKKEFQNCIQELGKEKERQKELQENCKILEDELNIINSQYNKEVKTNSQLAKDLEESSEGVKLKEKELNSLKAELEDSKKERKNLEKIIEKNNLELSSFQFELENNKKTLSSLQESESSLITLKGKKKTLKISLKNTENELENLKTLANELKAKNLFLDQSLQSLKKPENPSKPGQKDLPKNSLFSLCYESSFTYPSSQSLYKELQQKVQSFLQIISTDLKISPSIDSPQAILNIFSDQKNLICYLEAKTKEKEEELSKQQESLSFLSAKNSEFDLKLLESNHNFFELQKELQSTQSDLSTSRKEQEELKGSYEDLQKFYESIYSEKIAIIEKLEESTKSHSELQRKLLSEQIILQDLENKQESLEKLSQSLEAELKVKAADLEKLAEIKEKELGIMKDYVKNLEFLNDSLETRNNQLENRLKKSLSDQESDFQNSISALSEKVAGLETLNWSLQETVENLQGSIEKYKEKVSKLELEAQSLTETIRSLKSKPKLITCLEFCENFYPSLKSPDSISPVSFGSPNLDFEIETKKPCSDISQLLLEIETLAQKQNPESLILWCKKILNGDSPRRNDSGISDESLSHIERIDLTIDEGLDINGKFAQQGKIIENLLQRLEEKKERLRLSNINNKALQTEIRNLDSKLKKEGSFDLEYLKSSILNFSKNITKIDKESSKSLEIIQAQLGIKLEKETSKKWGIFSKKTKS